MDNFSTVISHKIRKVREIKGFSQEYIAGKLNLSQNAYSRIERGEIHISQEKLIQIASALEVDVEIIKNYSDSTIFNNFTNSGNFNHYIFSENYEKIETNYKSIIAEKDTMIQQLLDKLNTLSKKNEE